MKYIELHPDTLTEVVLYLDKVASVIASQVPINFHKYRMTIMFTGNNASQVIDYNDSFYLRADMEKIKAAIIAENANEREG